MGASPQHGITSTVGAGVTATPSGHVAGHEEPRLDAVQTLAGWEELSLVDAAERLGLTTEALRKRIQRGSVPGHKRDGQWYATLPPQGERPDIAGQVAGHAPDATSHNGTGDQTRPDAPETTAARQTVQGLDSDQTPPGEAAALRDEVAFLRGELEARRREVQQLHTLLAQAQQLALPPPSNRPDVRLDNRSERPDMWQDTEQERPDTSPQRRAWWKVW